MEILSQGNKSPVKSEPTNIYDVEYLIMYLLL